MVVGQAFVVEAHQVQHGGVNVVNVNAILDGTVTKFVGGTMSVSAFNPATCHPDGESMMIVIATGWVAATNRNLDGRGATKLTAANDQCLVQQSALMEIG